MLRNRWEDRSDDSDITFRDMITLALAGFVCMVIMLLPLINPPTKDGEEGKEPPGSVIVEVRWPDDMDADVDLWVQAPGDVPVGYSNKSGLVFNLLRDDLGKFGDLLNLNYENAYSRGIVPGEYTVNLHLYRNKAARYPIPATVVVSTKRLDKRTHPIANKTVYLTGEGQELTVFRFKLEENGTMVPNSLHDLPKPIRSIEK